jgi:hypothetical protein
MPRDPYDLDMPGPGDIWSQHTPFDDEDDMCRDCGKNEAGSSGLCECCQDYYDAHIDDKIDEMRDKEMFDDND